MKYLCEPCNHKWWQHRHPDPRMRTLGIVLMLAGAIQVVIGMTVIWRGVI